MPRRATDRIEDAVAWVLSAAALLLVVVAGLVGLGVHGREAERADRTNATISQARAVLLEDAEVVIGENGVHAPVPVPARWTDGRLEHTGAVLVDRPQPAGTEVDVYVNDAGVATTRPPRAGTAVFAGISAGFGVLLGGGTLLLALWFVVRGLTGLANARRWARQWVRVEPEWRRYVC